MDEPLGSGLIQSLGDFGQRHSRRGNFGGGGFQTGPKFLDQRPQ